MSDNQLPQVQEHPAIWLMRRLGRFLKWTVLIILAIAILGGGGTWAYFYWTDTLPTSQIKITVNKQGLDPQGKPTCTDPTRPLFILIFNDSRRTLSYVSFRLVAKQPDHSTNLVTDFAYATSDYITEPGIGGGSCWSLPDLASTAGDWRTLDWTAEVNSARFE